MRKRRVTFITGSRAEYGLLCSTMRAVRQQRGLQLQLIVTGMHLLKPFGMTVREIERDGWRIDARVRMQTGQEGVLSYAQGLSRGVIGIARCLERLKSDMVVVLGDRVEALAGALAAVCTGRILAHIHGGDVAPGHLDDLFRHTTTQLADYHFPATADAADRIARWVGSRKKICVVGAPGLDDFVITPQPRRFSLHGEFNLDRSHEVAIIVQHPTGRSVKVEYRVMMNIVHAVVAAGLNALIIHPNSDQGHSGIVRAIRASLKKFGTGRLASVMSLPRATYIQCLRGARLMVGNSSSGIIEAHTARTVAVNVGDRQKGRVRSGPYVIDSGEGLHSLKQAISKALAMKIDAGRQSAYRVGGTGKRIAHILARL